MGRCYLLHVVAVLRLRRSIQTDLYPAVLGLCRAGLLRCAATLDATRIPEWVQTVEPSLDELEAANSIGNGLGLPDRILLTLGRTRQLICVSDEPCLAAIANKFRVELLNTPRLIAELSVGGYLAESAPAVALETSLNVALSGGDDEHFPPQPSNDSLGVAAQGRRPPVRTRGRRDLALPANEQLLLRFDGTTPRP